MTPKHLIAIDLGASSGRLISGTFDGRTLTTAPQFRFSNQPVEQNGRRYWDVLKLYQEIKYGLNLASQALGRLDSLAVDTWGVDYGLVSARDELLMAPHSYRDTRAVPYAQQFEAKLPAATQFAQTGNFPAAINSNLQLFADLQRHPFLSDAVAQVLFMPGLVSWFLSGQAVNEYTIASTSGLLNATTRQWDHALMAELGIPHQWFTPVSLGGVDLGPILPEIAQERQLNPDLRVIAGAGHDTAAALLGLPIDPAAREDVAFISSGTWSIVGRQTARPVLSGAAFDHGLTNEGTFDGGNRLLKNVTGLWIVQQLQAEWSYQGAVVTYAEMAAEAAAVSDNHSYIDPNDPWFSEPGQMVQRITDYLDLTQQARPRSRGHLLRIVYESLALAYRQTLDQLAAATGKPIQVVHLFGGGIQNQLLVQLTADFTQREIVAGPVEASVMGNLVSQLLVEAHLDPAEAVAVLRASFTVERVQPATDDPHTAVAAFAALARPDTTPTPPRHRAID
ncbi:rhamnulokinase [Lacticaseibacillus absianus]|uniref:rhamnulokinase n=1 Tax=Lacticaseibacillus absianus TaxID=2729623 RepID=UPI0015C95E2B|nr:rhamnulokinase family protein [Lacticaseibacillus absianus]